MKIYKRRQSRVLGGLDMEIRLVTDEKYGYKRLDPIPLRELLDDFYMNEYYQNRKKTKSPDARIIKELDNLIEEISTVSNTEWAKKTHLLEAKNTLNRLVSIKKPSLLDVGCGYGTFIKFINEFGWNVSGIEPSPKASEFAANTGLNIHNCTLEEFYIKNQQKFTAISLNNVLEHVRLPLDTISMCKNMLIDGGIIRIKVPNEFNPLQLKANEIVSNKNWWVSYPDHINYFTKDSLTKILRDFGFEIVHINSDFPMEIFILMGENYVDKPELGKLCHEKRKNFEMNLETGEREKLYCELAKNGIGRNIIVYGKLRININNGI